MKKTFYLIFAFCAVFLSVIIFLNYSDGIYNAVFEDKTCVVIEKHESQTSDQFISDITSISNSTGVDILYATIEDASSKRPLFNIYTTAISTEFIDIDSNYPNSEIAIGQYLTTEIDDAKTNYKVFGSTLYTHFRFYSLSDAKGLELEHSKFYINTISLDILASALTSGGYNVSIVADENRLEESEAMMELHIMFVLLTVFMFFSIICFAFSVRKEIIIKKANGYDEISVFTSTFLNTLVNLPIVLIVVYLLSGIIVGMVYPHTLMSYIRYGALNVLAYLGVSVLLYLSACIYVQFMKSANEIRGNKPSRLLHFLAICLRLIVSAVIIWGLTCSLLAVKYEKNLEKAKENIGTIGDEYVVLSLNSGSVDFYGNNEEYMQKSKNLIISLIDRFNTVIVDSSEFMDMSESYERILYVNEGYFSLQPVYDTKGAIIDVGITDDDVLKILLPDNYSGEIIHFTQEHDIAAEIIYYASGQQFHTFNQFTAIDSHGIVYDPIIMLINDTELYWRAESIIGEQFMLIKCGDTNPYETLKSTIAECGMSSVVLEAQRLTDIFDVAIMNANVKVFQYLTVSVLYLIVLVIVTIFETTVYYENNKRMLTIKKLHGYGKYAYFEMFAEKTVVLIILVMLSLMLNYHIAFAIVASIIDIVVFLYYVEKLEHNSIVLYLKGDM